MSETAVPAATWGSAVSWAADVLDHAGCESARLDAELLLASVLGVNRTDLYLTPGASVGASDEGRFADLIERRAAREPVAYILGYKAFRRITLQVDPRVLIPRPETELLVEAGLELPTAARVVDVGTGSGAIALALKDEREDLEVFGIDLSQGALDLARTNAARLSLEVSFLAGDLLYGGPYDAVLANLPYVAEDQVLAPEISAYEPGSAVYGGADGLDLLRRLSSQLAGVQMAALEIGVGQADQVERLLLDVGFARVERLHDLAGHERVIVGRRER